MLCRTRVAWCAKVCCARQRVVHVSVQRVVCMRVVPCMLACGVRAECVVCTVHVCRVHVCHPRVVRCAHQCAVCCVLDIAWCVFVLISTCKTTFSLGKKFLFREKIPTLWVF